MSGGGISFQVDVFDTRKINRSSVIKWIIVSCWPFRKEFMI